MPPRIKASDWLTEEALIKLEGWARDGLTNEQIAEKMGCSPRTLYNWYSKHVPIMQALKRGKDVVDRQVEQALLKSALGYDHEEVKTYIEETANGKKKRIEKTTKHVPPNTTAQIFWLKNRKPDEWRDVRRHEHGGIDEEPIKVEQSQVLDVSKLTDEELDALERIVAKTTDAGDN